MEQNETLDNISDTKSDYEFTITSGREPRHYTAGVRIWNLHDNVYYFEGYWDMPNAIDSLGTPTTVVANDPQTINGLPIEVLREAQNFLFMGIDIMNEQNLHISKSEIERVYNMVD